MEQANINYSILEEERAYIVSTIYVPEEQRGHGKARDLLTSVINERNADNPSYSVYIGFDYALWSPLEPSTNVKRLQRFFKKLGFVSTGIGSEMVLKGE